MMAVTVVPSVLVVSASVEVVLVVYIGGTPVESFGLTPLYRANADGYTFLCKNL